MKFKGSELAPLGTFDAKVPKDVKDKVAAKEKAILDGKFAVKVVETEPKSHREVITGFDGAVGCCPIPVLRLEGITKRFGPLVANDAVSLALARGEILALLGENGAGKSTLVSILFGHYVADAGTIEAFGRPLPPGDPAPRSPRASAWCTSTRRWPTTSRCSTT
jgi:ABC-type glutathione transport system ATPase component